VRKAYLEGMSLYSSPASSDAGCQQATPLTVRVREACRLTGIGRSKLYELIAAEEIETIKVGTITLIPMVSLEQFLKRRRFG
jgi:excisionase family DNA binding protein